jgi:hypothetical protein
MLAFFPIHAFDHPDGSVSVPSIVLLFDNIFAREQFCTKEDLKLASGVSVVSTLEREWKNYF